ncbi:hypothetical protein GBA65_06420 [Rubrobacter marinus]|uniref:Uncharacterized protein n=1 Tax=Rubrobacter marinus TaxID=2653852 RepID=A0A6G8PVJ9_9ACTN|nr:hypothetical protein [Rubrobacter marinus]QIN78205.1 hypothetical protein GBA65_06420 [Rubrobacter marinus]
MSGEAVAQVGTTAVSLLALVLSLLNLWLQRRDRRPRLGIRVRYEYRAGEGAGTDEDRPARIHDDSQAGLYLRLGDFLREHGLRYPQGKPVVRFALSNEGQRTIYLEGVHLVLRSGWVRAGGRRVLNLTERGIVDRELAGETANVLFSGGEDRLPVEIVPGDGVGYRFGLIRLAEVLKREGYEGNVRLAFEATDRLGNSHRLPFEVDTAMWAHRDEGR